MTIYKQILIFIFCFLNFNLAIAAGLTYQGRIFKPDGTPLESSSVQFRLQVRTSGSENCLLFEELQTLNMQSSLGVFSMTLNDGSGIRLDTASYNLENIFSNRGTFTLDSTRCVSGTTYTPSATDNRKFIVYFKDDSMSAYEALPIMNVNFVPTAMYALEAQKLGTFGSNHVLRAVDGSGNPATAPALDPTQLTNLTNLLAGTSTQYATSTQFGTVQSFAKSAPPTCGAGEVLKSNGTTLSCVVAGGSSTLPSSGVAQTNTIDNTNFSQIWNWSTATTQSPMSISANALTTGSAMNVSTSSASLNSTNGLINVANTSASTNGILARFQSNSTAGSGLTVLANGNVGIGTAAPQRIFDINGFRNGTGTVTATAGSTTVTGSGTLFTSELSVGDSIQFTGDARTVISIASDTSLGIDTSYPSTYSNSVFTIRKPIVLNGGATIFGSTTATRVHSSSIFGNVVPAYEFVSPNSQAWSSFTDLMVFRHKNSGTYNISQPQSMAFLMKMGDELGSGDAFGGGGLVFETNSGWMTNPTLSLINGNARRVTITSAGNVGIGTTTPGQTLQVQGNTLIGDPTIGFFVDGAANRVGIGTTSPGITTYSLAATRLLSIYSQLPVLELAATGVDGPSTPLGYLNFGMNSQTGSSNKIVAAIGSQSEGPTANNRGGKILFQTKSDAGSLTTKMILDSSGNVGIGTTSPANKLSVAVADPSGSMTPQLAVSNSSASGKTTIQAQNSSTGYIGLVANGASYSYAPYVNTAAIAVANVAQTVIVTDEQTSNGGTAPFKIVTGGYANTPSITVLAGNPGNIGIGTTSPQTSLQVAGVISPATNNTYTLGNATYRFTEVYATNGVINTSDRREKKDIYNSDLGLDFINKLRPVSYRWNTGVDNDVHYGLIAQEAEQAITDVGQTETTSIVTHDETIDRYGVRYSELISPLIKAVQELYIRILGIDREIASVKAEKADKSEVDIKFQKLESENQKLKQENAAMKIRLDKIEAAILSK